MRTVRRLVIVVAIALGLAAIVIRYMRVRTPAQPAAKCQRDPASTDYQVCVVDEAGRPLAGVTVHGEYTRYGGSGPYTDTAGTAITGVTGLATFKRPAPHGPGDERPMWAIAERAGWPPQAETVPGTIVLGPPRTMRGTLRFAIPCKHADARVGVDNAWDYAMGDPQPLYLEVDLHDDRSFTFENLGPGVYHLSAGGCESEHAQSWSGDVRGSDLVNRALELRLR